ncbi:MAG: elongation factor Tu [Candidatus Nomurabacteria bacterium GW2011_GWF2_43_8]|uniref:Elongation factor Tu n=1 Tax=Candidatus Nomurabacteria bacterium GW2011_GWF2_43_8 TaxID=1618779 RepID=A0A0G1HQS1_9BACT|nr:MAG: elongation factor Tu [Candidatus Nomurabacteria bacterium GW2011_GWF2_43_8]
MAEEFKRDKPHINVGTIGHVDHGKTTLTAEQFAFAESTKSTTLPRKKREVLRLTFLTTSTRPMPATTRTSTLPDTRTTSRT